MPVIGIPVNMLLERIHSRPDRDQLVEHLQHLGCDVEGYARMRRFGCKRCDNLMEITETENPPVLCDRCGADFKADESAREARGESDVLRMELLAVRPDMFDPGGLARVLRNYLGESLEPASYELEEPTITVKVDPGLASVRPCIACAVVRGITLDDDRIKVIMKLQENLHWALGRDRKRASIGVYDLDKLSGTAYEYRSVGPSELEFTPLGLSVGMTPARVLSEHPKGMAYARLLAAFDRYPLLVDGAGQVLSMPPIINSEETRVTHGTRNFFVDVTGSEERIVWKTLNTLVTSLAELDKHARLEAVTIEYPERRFTTPDLTMQSVTLDAARTARLIGVDLDRDGVVERLRRMGHGVSVAGSQLEVLVPAYRNDIMHEIDLVEDVAIAYGYHNIETRLVPNLTVGRELPLEKASSEARQVFTGLGYYEVLTLILSSEEAQYDGLRRPRLDNHVVIEHPISIEQTMVRVTLLAGLLDTLAANTDHELPQRIFEVGNTTLLDSGLDTGARETKGLAAACLGPRVDFAEVRSLAECVLREFGWGLAAEPSADGVFIPGRGARVFAVKGHERREVGVMGEVHPEVLVAHKLIHPAAVLELSLELLTA